MRIGIDARILQDALRGQGQYVYYLVQELIKLDQDNEYKLFYNGFKRGKFIFPQDIANLKQAWSRLPGSLLRFSWPNFKFPPIERLLGGIDVFHHTFNYNFTHYTPVPSRARMVVTFNGMADPADIWDRRKYNFKEIGRWFRLITKDAGKIIAVSNMVKDDLLKKVNIQPEKIKVIYYGVDQRFKPVEDKCKRDGVLSKYGLSGKKYILYVGAAEKNKNLDRLLEAFKIVSSQENAKDIFLVLGGSIDGNFQRLIDKADGLGLNQRVIFPGYISHDFLPYLYSGAELFILPTLQEWFGIPVLEAMSSGVPVAVSRNTGALEIVGDAAVTFNPIDVSGMASAVERILNDQGFRANLVEKGISMVSKFTWKKTAEETLSVYQEVYQ